MLPDDEGVNVTLKVQEPPAGTAVPLAHGLPPLPVAVNCPLALMLEMVTVELRWFVSVTVTGELEAPTAVVPKVMLAGASVIGKMPVPVRL